jgi:hypothetical protein
MARAVLVLREGNWTIEIPIYPSCVRDGLIPTPRWLISADPIKFARIQQGSTANVK